MSMKPWDREIKQMERGFSKTIETENQKINLNQVESQKAQEANSKTLNFISFLKEKNKQEVLAQYFNYGFDESSFKTYIN